MSTAPHAAPVPLAPPGAGIPAIERLVGGTLFALRRRLGTRDQFAAQFAAQRHAIHALYHARPAATLGRRTLIPRLRGLEDSSRFWSVWMTLDHLRIVNEQIAGVIDALVQGRTPPGVASTAAVKPSPDVGPDAARAHEAACDRFASLLASTPAPALRTAGRYAHPWFGPLDAHGWHAMAAMHMGIHRAQIARILGTLDRLAP